MRLRRALWQGGALAVLVGGLAVLAPRFASGADHTDSAAAGSEPLADIGDLYAWMDGTAANVNLVMTFGGVSQPAEFGTAVTYVFHIHRGAAFGNTPDETRVMCQFADASNLECWVRDLSGAMPTTVAYVAGDPSDTAGITSDSPAGVRVFAGYATIRSSSTSTASTTQSRRCETTCRWIRFRLRSTPTAAPNSILRPRGRL